MSTLELVRFRFRNQDPTALAASTTWLEQQPGFQSRIVASDDAGHTVDLVLWDDAASAARAAGAFPQAAEVQSFLESIDRTSVTMEHLGVVAGRPVADLRSLTLAQLGQARAFFAKSTDVLKEEHSSFRPTPEMMSVACQVAHVAITINWFVDGVFGAGFDLDFERLDREAAAFDSLTAARACLADAFELASARFGAAGEAELAACLPPNPILPQKPRFTVAASIAEHTAHHRGALTVYARVLGLVPEMPYS